jgi:hypothetical protein
MLDEATRGFQSPSQFKRLAETRLTEITPPTRLGGKPIEDVIAAAASGPDDGGAKDYMVYLVTSDDCSDCRVGEGKADRPLAHMTAYLLNTTPAGKALVEYKRQTMPSYWRMKQSLIDMLAANGGRASYIILADNLSKQQSLFGQMAVATLLGLRRHGGFLINENYQ